MFLLMTLTVTLSVWPYNFANDRQQTDNWTWSSSSPYTSFYTYGNGDQDAEFGVFNVIGKPYTEDNQRTSYDNGGPPELGYIHVKADTWPIQHV